MKLSQLRYKRKVDSRSWLTQYEAEEVELWYEVDENHPELDLENDLAELRLGVDLIFRKPPIPEPMSACIPSKGSFEPGEVYMKTIVRIGGCTSGVKLIAAAKGIARDRPYENKKEKEGVYEKLFMKAEQLFDSGAFGEAKYKSVCDLLEEIKSTDDSSF